MPVPKWRHNKSRRDKRRGQIYIKAPLFTICKNCLNEILPHTICERCGHYKGKEILKIVKAKKGSEGTKKKKSKAII